MRTTHIPHAFGPQFVNGAEMQNATFQFFAKFSCVNLHSVNSGLVFQLCAAAVFFQLRKVNKYKVQLLRNNVSAHIAAALADYSWLASRLS
jgi:hypothetical protein